MSPKIKSKITIAPLLEISSVVLIDTLTKTDTAEFLGNPKNFIASKLHVNTDDVDILVAENNNEEVHLALPYYSYIETVQAEMLKDTCLENITGGEILITASAFGGFLIAGVFSSGYGVSVAGAVIGGALGVATLAAIAAGAVAGVRSRDGENIDGSKK